MLSGVWRGQALAVVATRSRSSGGVNSFRCVVLPQSFRFGVEIAYVGATILDVCKRVRKKTLVGGNHQSKAFSYSYLLHRLASLFIWICPRVCALSQKVAFEVTRRGRWPCCPGPTPTCLMRPSG